MNKIQSPISHTVCLTNRSRSILKPKLSIKVSNGNTIASLNEAQNRIKQLQKMHKWRKQRRLRLLHDTYDQNCRLYMSINSQKSVYSLYRAKIQALNLSNKNKTHLTDSQRYDTQKILKAKDMIKQNKPVVLEKINQSDNYRLKVRQILKDSYQSNKLLPLKNQIQTTPNKGYKIDIKLRKKTEKKNKTVFDKYLNGQEIQTERTKTQNQVSLFKQQ